MIKFETNVCPLCSKVMTLRKVAGVTVFQCSTGALTHSTHYEVEVDTTKCIQHMYVGDWSIDNFSNATRSRLYRQSNNGSGSIKWRLMKEVPFLRPDLEERMLERIQQLVQ